MTNTPIILVPRFWLSEVFAAWVRHKGRAPYLASRGCHRSRRSWHLEHKLGSAPQLKLVCTLADFDVQLHGCVFQTSAWPGRGWIRRVSGPGRMQLPGRALTRGPRTSSAHPGPYVHRLSWWVWDLTADASRCWLFSAEMATRRSPTTESASVRPSLYDMPPSASVSGKATVTNVEALKRAPARSTAVIRALTVGWRQCPSCGVVPEITRGDFYSLADEAEAAGQRTIRI